jgi:hypothetical protein
VNQQSQQSRPAIVSAIYVSTDQQHRAFQVVDAVDELDGQLGAFRAVAQLAQVEHLTTDEGLPQLRRSDLAKLLSVLNTDLSVHCAKVRDAAMFSAVGSSQVANPV